MCILIYTLTRCAIYTFDWYIMRYKSFLSPVLTWPNMVSRALCFSFSSCLLLHPQFLILPPLLSLPLTSLPHRSLWNCLKKIFCCGSSKSLQPPMGYYFLIFLMVLVSLPLFFHLPLRVPPRASILILPGTKSKIVCSWLGC